MSPRLLLFVFLLLAGFAPAQKGCPDCIKKYNQLKETQKGDQLGDSLFLHIYRVRATDYHLADSLSRDFIRLSGLYKNNWIKGKAHLARGLVFNDAGKFNESIQYFHTAINYLDDRKTTIDLCYAYQLLSAAFDALASWDLALKTTEQSLKLSLQLDNKTLIGNNYSRFGIMYNKKGHYQKAKSYFFKALSIRKELSDTFSIITAYTNLGNVYYKLEKTDSALYFLDKALSLTNVTKDDYSMGYVHNDLGALYHKTQQYDLAKWHLKVALDARRKIDDNWEIGYTLNYLGWLYHDLGNFNESRNYLYQAVELARGNGNTKQEYESYELLSKLFASNGKYDSAYFYSEKHSHLRDSMIRKQNLLAADALVTNYEFDKKQKEIELLKKRSEIQALKIGRQRWILLSLSAGVLFSIIAVYYIIRSRNLKMEKLKVESLLKEQDLRRESELKLNEDRKRISRELHDNIGTNLTLLKSSITGISEETQLSELNQLAEETIRELRKSVWLLNHKETELEEWVVKLREYFRYVPYLKVEYLNTNTKELLVESSILSELFRVCQEAVNNALKHSGCDEIILHIRNEGVGLELEITDNGRGFDDAITGQGSGLANMTYRVEKFGGTITRHSRLEIGTKIIVKVDLYVKSNA